MENTEPKQPNPLAEITAEEFITNCRRGEKLRRSLKPQIGELLLQERLKRRMPLEEVSRYVKFMSNFPSPKLRCWNWVSIN